MSQPTDARSPIARALRTPIGELVRGRIGPSPDTDSILARADLPHSLTTAIRAVLQRARLWRAERADVAAELASHFRDGLDAGRTSEDLLSDFGDPARAARLIRRAKRRNRPLAWRLHAACWAAIGWALLLLLGLYILLFARYLMLRPTIARNYSAELNAPILAIPERDRAWPLYREAYLALTPLTDGSPSSFGLPAEGEPPRLVDSLGAWALRPEELDRAAAYLRRNAGALDTLRRAAARPAMGLPISDAFDLELVRHAQVLGLSPDADLSNYRTTPSENPSLIATVMPDLAYMRQMARLLATDARIAADGPDAERAAADILAILAMADHVRSRGWLINDLVGIALHALALDTTNHLITERPDLLTDAQITRLAHAVGMLGRDGPLVRFDGERLGFDDTLQRIYSDNGRGNGVLTRGGIAELESLTSDFSAGSGLALGEVSLDMAIGPIQSAVVADRASTRALFNRFIDAIEERARIPLWDQPGTPSVDVQIEQLYQDPLGRARYPIVALMVPALESATRHAELTLQRRDTTLTLLALELHRRRAGAYPDTLAEFAPTLLPITPRDRLTGQTLCYTLRDGHPVLYSRGADKDDDGGRPVDPADRTVRIYSYRPHNHVNALMNGRGSEPGFDGDWILWPPTAEPE